MEGRIRFLDFFLTGFNHGQALPSRPKFGSRFADVFLTGKKY